MKTLLLKFSALMIVGFGMIPHAYATIFEGAGDGNQTDTQRGVEFVNTALTGSGVTPTGDFGLLLLKYINFFLPYLALGAFIGYVVAGVLWVMAFGNEELLTKAKKILIYSTIGLLVVIISYALVTLFTSGLVEFINKP